jgi:hypothetical protein
LRLKRCSIHPKHDQVGKGDKLHKKDVYVPACPIWLVFDQASCMMMERKMKEMSGEKDCYDVYVKVKETLKFEKFF